MATGIGAQQTKGSIYALLSAMGFGSMPIFANFAYQTGDTVETVLAWRFFFAALLMWGIVWLRRMPARFGWKLTGLSILLGVFGYAGETDRCCESFDFINI